ncbi:unnamed protein product [Vitrella brassicaformis CCMP3155]|uniref:Uncharacterized protein n=2 Tax=Vitrella brassicaformis TaxID=1169539 RepID=A0A0G4EAW0_VITBC|nr:unnamed protein product [Vitrella brassicaformis CCMP3155]|eukprot:CEL92588.1 unnamed protein product [Vitrella brassicaformis CCMP3155]
MQTAARVQSFFVICLSVALSTLPLQAAGRLAGRDNSTALLALLTSSWNCFENMQCLFPSQPSQCSTGLQCMSKAACEDTMGGRIASGLWGSTLTTDAQEVKQLPCTHEGMEEAISMFKSYKKLNKKVNRLKDQGQEQEIAKLETELNSLHGELYYRVKGKFFDLGCVCCKAVYNTTFSATSKTSPSKASSFKPPTKKQSRMDPSFEFILDNIPGLGSNAKKLIRNL